MEDILKSIGLQNAIPAFEREKIVPEAVGHLSSEQLTELGVTRMVDMALLKSRCSRVNAPTSSIAEERRTLFQGMPRYTPYNTGNIAGRGHRRAQKGKTFTIKLFCLSQVNATAVPKMFIQQNLKRAGLGESAMVVGQDATAAEVNRQILEMFPKAGEGGGIEFLKANNTDRKFEVIPCPVGGYTAKYIKEIARQSRVYIRPIQKNLDLTSVVGDTATIEDDIKEACRMCNKLVPQSRLRRHVRSCKNDNTKNSRPSPSDRDDMDFQTNIYRPSPSDRDDMDFPDPFTIQLDTDCPNGLSSMNTKVDVPSTSSRPPRSMTGNVTTSSDELSSMNTKVDVPSTSSRPPRSMTGNVTTSSDDHTYNEYTSLMDTSEMLDEEYYIDDDIDDVVIEESLKDIDNTDVALDALMQQKVGEFQMRRKHENETVTIVIRRSKLMRTAVLATDSKRASFFLKEPVIHFSGEDATDLGGPKREFFRLLMDQLPMLFVFEGEPSKMYFSHDIDLIQREKYRLAGRFVSWSILHGGPGFYYLHPVIYELMCTGSSTGKLSIDDIKDIDVYGKLKKSQPVHLTLSDQMSEKWVFVTLSPSDVDQIDHCLTQEDVDRVIDDVGDWAAGNGCSHIYNMKIDEKDNIIQNLLKQHMYYRCKTAIDQFTLGMDDVCGFWGTVKSDWRAFKSLFLRDSKKALTATILRQLFRVHLSEERQIREEEEDTVFSWEKLLVQCEEGKCELNINSKKSTLGLNHILMFTTGADCIPPMGFDKQIDIKFFCPTTNGKNYPVAHTCAMEIHLPRKAADSDQFSKLVAEAIFGSHGYGKE